jgi:hypothetical protein
LLSLVPEAENMARDILGLSGADAQIHNHSDADDLNTVTAEDDQAKRRRRMSEGADELTPTPTSPGHHKGGATGVDIGAGGNGTDID